jgi:FAD/FMN-containing dehydrogenase
VIELAVKNVPQARDPLPGAPYLCLLEFEGADLAEPVETLLAAAIEAGLVDDATIAQNEAQAQAFWLLREELAAGHRKEGRQVNCDISVPVSRTPAFIAEAGAAARRLCPGARIVAFGHMGDGNIHYSVLAPEGGGEDFPHRALYEACHDCAVRLGGSISAEHGIGVVRREELARFKSPEAMALMRTLKAALDPKKIMNPRALL